MDTNANLALDRKEVATGSGEMVCWVAFVDRLRIAQGDVDSVYSSLSVIQAHQEKRLQPSQTCAAPTVPYMRILRRSWDFMVSYSLAKNFVVVVI